MTIQTLPRPTATPAVERARACLDDARGVALDRVEEAELGELVTSLAAIESQAAALRLAALAEAEARQTAERSAATGTDAWAAGLTGDTREAAAGGLRIARLLAEKYHHTREAYAAGELRTAQVRVIVEAAEQSPPEATPAQIVAAEEILVGKATGRGTRSGRPMNARRLRQAARRMFDPVDHDLADRHEAILLGREARYAARETYLAMHDNLDGTFSGRFTVPELHGSLLRHAIERLTAPRRTTSTSDPAADLSAPDAPGSGLGGHEKAGHAFCEIIEHLPTTGWTGANALTFLATMNLPDLVNDLRDRSGATTWAGPDETGTVRLDTGTTLSAGDFRRLACEAGLVPVVLGGDSVPLDLGRLRRLHDIHQRRALAVIWTSCAITGCERPFAWCEIHHPKPWSEGGGTDLHNALPLCFWHHHRAHDPAWDLSQHPTYGWRLRPAAATRRRRPTSPDG